MIKIKLKLILFIVFSAAVVGVGFYFLLLPQFNRNNPVKTLADNVFGWKFPITKFPAVGSSVQLAYSSIRDPGGIPQGLPMRLQIPVIGVDSAIEDALITPDGRMDVPAGSVNVAWFSLGPHPGDIGSAVIGGHFGISNGVPFVFYNLDKLKVGDKIYVVNDKGQTLAFVVRLIKSFDRNADATPVFTSNDGLAHLNLITCEGIWNQVNGNYPQRLVIFTDAIPSEGVAPVSSFHRSLSVGARGADVVVLQTALIQKGFLKMPVGVVKGYFGPLTRTAVAKYQTSVGLSSNGVFGSLTRSKLMPEIAIAPTLPSTAIMVPESISTSTSPIFIRSIKSLYATPADTLVTSILLISIIFVGFIIIR